MTHARYDAIGDGYASTRREDPDWMRRIDAALGPARTVVNVGAGAGSYEPRGRVVIPVEPSAVMAAQRPADRPAVRAFAHALPLHDKSVDAAMTVLSLHHWDDQQEAGVREMARVARQRVVILTIDPHIEHLMWLMADYLTEVAELDRRIFPPPARVAAWLGGASIEAVPISRDTPDWSLMSFWAHPGRVLDPAARQATSGFARQTDEVVARVVRDVGRDLADGTWDRRYGHLRDLDAYDCGLRLIVADLTRGARDC